MASLKFDELANGLIAVRARVNKGKDETFLVDLGSTATLTIDSGSADRAGLPVQIAPNALLVEGNGGRTPEIQGWRSGTVRDGKVILAQGTFPESDLLLLGKIGDAPLAGLLGVPIASRYVVEINYDLHVIRLYDAARFIAPEGSEALDLLPNPQNDLLIVRARVTFASCTTASLRMYLDSGLGADMTFSRAYFIDHPGFFPTTGTADGMAFGGEKLAATGVTVRGLQLGALSAHASDGAALTGVPERQVDRVSDGAIGAPVLRQFNLFLDTIHRKLYLSPRAAWPKLPGAAACKPLD